MNQREFFDNHAATWDADRNQKQVAIIESLMRAIDIKADQFVLDVGTGTGVLFPFFKQMPFVAIDISFNMLKRAQEKYHGHSVLVHADVCALPFASGTFDRAVLFAVFPHINDKAKALIDLHTVLKPGGRIDILHAASRETINEFHQKHGGPIEYDSIPERSAMHTLLAKSGFKKIMITELPDRYITTAVK
jgi:ubiquinone/menaquinone biosynthesis C-methylase UbiE